MDQPPITFEHYQCPGEAREISRTTHLGRLASFYPACRLCACRFDSGSLPPSQQKQLDALFRTAPSLSLLFDEGLVGITPTDIHLHSVRKAASAFANVLKTSGPVLIGCDGRPETSELIAAAAEGLRMANVDVIEVGPATVGSFEYALQTTSAQGGVMLGNARSQRREISLKFWGRAGEPISAGAELALLEQTLFENPPRTSRTSGTLDRLAVEADYLAALAPLFHALRPLAVHIDCDSSEFWRYLHLLSGNVACRFVSSKAEASVHTSRFDLQLAIDADGETLRLWDERGTPVTEHQMLMLLAMKQLRDLPKSAVVAPAALPAKWRKTLTKRGGQVVVAEGTSRRELHRCLLQAAAIAGGGSAHRYWLTNHTSSSPAPTSDALLVVAQLLNLLSESDEPLSHRLLADF